MTPLRLFACALLLLATAPRFATAVEPGSVLGVVRDPAGAPVLGASVSLLSPLGSIAATTRTDAAGEFRLDAVPPGSYVLAAALPGFTTRRLAVRVEANRAAEPLAVDLQPEAYRDEITVTATPGRAVALEDVPQRVNVIGEEEIVEFCRLHLAAFKVPRKVEFRSELPKSMVGKYLRRVLVEEERAPRVSAP